MLKLALGLTLSCLAFGQSNYTIETLAGVYTGTGDGGPAMSAILQLPYSVALDSSGNLYIADYGNEAIRRVDAATGLISTLSNTRIAAFDLKVDALGTVYISRDAQILKIAANGTQTVVANTNRTSGYNGDGIPAVSAEVTFVDCIALDSAGNLYFTDRDNQRVREITSDGVVHTLAGTGHAGYNADGIPATSADLNMPRGITVDATGNVFFVDSSNHRVREITPDGIIHTIAGTGVASMKGDGGPAVQAGLGNPWSLQIDGNGNLYVSDSSYIRRIDAVDGAIRTVVGNGDYVCNGDGGPAVAAGVDPHNYTLDSSGNLFIADEENGLIRMVTPDGTIQTIAGSLPYGGDGGPASAAQLNQPQYVAFDAAGSLYISDTYNHRVRKIDATGNISTYAGTGQQISTSRSGPATSVNLGLPTGLAFDAAGNLYMADNWKCRIDRITPDGQLDSIAGGSCGYSGDGGPATAAQFGDPEGLAIDAAGNLYVGDHSNFRIRKIAPDGTVSTFAGTGSSGAGPDGVPATESAIDPWGVTVDAAGNLYIADYGSYRIRKVDPSGIISTVAGNGHGGTGTSGKPATSQPLGEPTGVALDSQGNLYITQWNSAYIWKVDPSGILTALAGNGQWSYTGDGGPARSASMSITMGPAVDGNGNVYFADMSNNVIRELIPVAQ